MLSSSAMSTLRTAALAGALLATALGTPAVAAADNLNAIPPALLDTTCTVDQLMAATKIENPSAYSQAVQEYAAQPPWIQGGIVYHLNLLLQKTPAERQAEVDQLAGLFPQFVPLFLTEESTANQIAAKCPTLPAVDPTVWTPAS